MARLVPEESLNEHLMPSAMIHSHVDPKLIFAWQSGHSLARGSPLPVHDRGGFRVDTQSEKEVKRWVFPRLCEGLRAIAHDIDAPRHYLTLCGSNEELRGALPPRWELQPINYFMMAPAAAHATKSLPDGYRIELRKDGRVSRASVIAPNGDLAASGCAAETSDVFVYDRIETAPDHRRKGLGIGVMNALGESRTSALIPQVLVATEDGRNLYENLGWVVLAPIAAAVIPEG